MPEQEALLRAAAPSLKRTVYTEAMQIFHRAAELISLPPRVRLELEEPDYEHIFYVTIKLRDRLVPMTHDASRSFADLPVTKLRNPMASSRSQMGNTSSTD